MENNEKLSEKAYIITGPTSGIGYEAALELAQRGTVVLVGRSPGKLKELEQVIRAKGQNALSVVCDVSDMESVKRAAEEIAALNLPIRGLLNNAGIMQAKATKSKQGWDMTFATNYLGAFLLTETLKPHLRDGTNVVFIASAVEDPERKPSKMMGMRGARYISAEASARGEWKEGGSKLAGSDAYATSKQCVLAATMVFARETPNIHFNAVEPGITPGTGLSGDASAFMSFLFGLITYLPPFARYRSTPKRAAKNIVHILTDESGKTGVYFDEKGRPMNGSELVRNPQFQERVVAETRELLSHFDA